jgi:hypothetical protein
MIESRMFLADFIQRRPALGNRIALRSADIKRIGLTILLAAAVGVGSLGLTGCAKSPAVDVSQYFGKNEKQILELLGEPSGKGRPSFSTRGNLAFVIEDPDYIFWLEEKLSPPLTLLKLHFSKSGLCNQLDGTVKGYETPEEVLDAIGFKNLQKERRSSDELGFGYRMPPYGLVQVHRPSSMHTKYTDFNLHYKAAGIPK